MAEVSTNVDEAVGLVVGRDFAGRQIVGTRSGQEDCYGVVPPDDLGGRGDLLVILADGMGGHAAGEVASALAVDTFAQSFFESPQTEDPGRLWDSLEAANARIGGEIEASGGELEGMGTTLLAMLVREGGWMHWISVGDSPLYLWRNGELRRLNEMHLWSEALDELVKVGALSKAEALADRERNTLIAALIGGSLHEVDDSARMDLQPGDILVATSDGVNTLGPEGLSRVLERDAAAEAGAIAEAILDAVRMRNSPRQDNATVVVVRIPGERCDA